MIIIQNHFWVGYGDGMPAGVRAGNHILNLFPIVKELNWLIDIT